MRPVHWEPSIELSASEQVIMKRIRRAKLFIFLREHRHEVFDAAFQEELARLYQDSLRGQPPVPPALLALATILQAYTGASDDEVIEAKRGYHADCCVTIGCIDSHRIDEAQLMLFAWSITDADVKLSPIW